MIKRLFDILVASLGIILLWPVMVLIGLVVLVTMGRPVLFRQTRPGLGGRPFQLLKFRTMHSSRPQATRVESDSERVTCIGRTLRRFSLDELPQLFNVLRGDLSLVGPRPLLPEYLPLYSARQARRHEVRPGITGWAQVNGRNALSWPEKLELDAWYVEHHSLWMDIRILARTVQAILSAGDRRFDGSLTMEPFRGEPAISQDAGQSSAQTSRPHDSFQ